MSWHLKSGETRSERASTHIDPASVGWTYCGLQVYDLEVGPITVELKQTEGILLPLTATDVHVEVQVGDESFTQVLKGRTSVFESVSDWAYLPIDSMVVITGSVGEVALCTARANISFPFHYEDASRVPVELRGAGNASRQVNNIATASSFGGAHKINVCEVLTPGGNFSSWPPHRHDGLGDCPTNNEEIYFFKIDNMSVHPSQEGYLHVYSAKESLQLVDEMVVIGNDDSYVIPHGFHGPSIAPPESTMYFLNVLAGPAEERSMAFCDDPLHHWIRESWSDLAIDPRLPLTKNANEENL